MKDDARIRMVQEICDRKTDKQINKINKIIVVTSLGLASLGKH